MSAGIEGANVALVDGGQKKETSGRRTGSSSSAAQATAAIDLSKARLGQLDPATVLSSLTAQQIQAVIDQKFVHMDGFGEILAMALRTGENVILWGPAGQAKSELVEHILSALNLAPYAKIQACDIGTEVASLFGGINFKALNEKGQLEYALEESIFGKEIAILEEVFDASPEVLASLKNALTAKMVYTENKAFPVRTRSIIACTNRSPEEIAKLGESYRALIDRFPLQVEVKWPSYKSDDYLEMFLKRGYPATPQVQRIADIIAKSGSKDNPITPRTAMKALKFATDHAAMRGKSVIDSEAIYALRHMPEIRDAAQASLKTWAQEMDARELRESMDAFSAKLSSTIDAIRNGHMTVHEGAETIATMREEWSAALKKYPAGVAKSGAALTKSIDSTLEAITGFKGKLSQVTRAETTTRSGGNTARGSKSRSHGR